MSGARTAALASAPIEEAAVAGDHNPRRIFSNAEREAIRPCARRLAASSRSKTRVRFVAPSLGLLRLEPPSRAIRILHSAQSDRIVPEIFPGRARPPASGLEVTPRIRRAPDRMATGGRLTRTVDGRSCV